MKKVAILPSFERSVRKLIPFERKKIAQTLDEFNRFLVTGIPSCGFGFKKIGINKFEFRVDLKLRVVVKEEGDIYFLVLAGTHDQICRYLRKNR